MSICFICYDFGEGRVKGGGWVCCFFLWMDFLCDLYEHLDYCYYCLYLSDKVKLGTTYPNLLIDQMDVSYPTVSINPKYSSPSVVYPAFGPLAVANVVYQL